MRITSKGQVTIPVDIRDKAGLLPAKENVTLGNGTFESKRPTRLASPFTTTQDVGNSPKWDAEEIRYRQVKLAELAPKVWPL